MNLREELRDLVSRADEIRKARELEAARRQQEQDERDYKDGARYALESMDWVVEVIKSAASEGKKHYDWPLGRTSQPTLTHYVRGHAEAIQNYMKDRDIGAHMGYEVTPDKEFDHYLRIFWM